MSTFTVPLWKVIEMTGGTVSRDAAGTRIMTGGDIGLGYFQCYEPEHKEILVGKIIDHYWNHEIGTETISMFQLAMLRKMNEIMPYYNQLYKTETLEFDPLSTIKLHTLAVGDETQVVNATVDTANTTENTSESKTLQSTFPQTMISSNGDYATSGAEATTKSNGTASGTDQRDSNSQTDNNTETTVEGYQAYPARLVQQYRDILINIDVQIIDELAECFMGVWNNADTYTPPRYNMYYGTFGTW